MSINVSRKHVDVADKELLLVGEGYIARPVTVNKDTITGLKASDDGRYYIPCGTFLRGEKGTLLNNPNQVATAATIVVTADTGVVGSAVLVTAKLEGASGITVEFKKGTAHKTKVVVNEKAIVVNLAVDKAGEIKDTWDDVIAAINQDMYANSLVIASLNTAADGSALAAVAAEVSLTGGSTTVVTGDIDGILYHTVDVTDGEAVGAMIIHGYINEDAMPINVGDTIKEKLPNIVFGSID